MTLPLVSAIVGEAAALAGLETGQLLKTYRKQDEAIAARRAMWALRILRPDLSTAVLGVWFDRHPASIRRSIDGAHLQRDRDPFERREQALLLAAFTAGGDHAQAA
jgi:hypothetical protein